MLKNLNNWYAEATLGNDNEMPATMSKKCDGDHCFYLKALHYLNSLRMSTYFILDWLNYLTFHTNSIFPHKNYGLGEKKSNI